MTLVKGGAAPKMLARGRPRAISAAFEADNDNETLDLSEIRASVEATIASPVAARRWRSWKRRWTGPQRHPRGAGGGSPAERL